MFFEGFYVGNCYDDINILENRYGGIFQVELVGLEFGKKGMVGIQEYQ